MTFALQCDRCTIAISVDEDADYPHSLGSCEIRNLHAIFPSTMTIDTWSVPNILQKLSHTVAFASMASEADWSCLVETDVYFSPVNFKRFVQERNLSVADVHWLGHLHLHSVVAEGVTMEPATGTCFSAAALAVAGRETLTGRQVLNQSVWGWPPTERACNPFELGVHGMLGPVHSVCMRGAGVWPPHPRTVHDDQGRFLFVPWAYNRNLTYMHPPSTPRPRYVHRRDFVMQWKGRELVYQPCQGHNPHWVADYPISFHGHTTHDPRHVVGSRSAWKARNPSIIQVHNKVLANDYRFVPW